MPLNASQLMGLKDIARLFIEESAKEIGENKKLIDILKAAIDKDITDETFEEKFLYYLYLTQLKHILKSFAIYTLMVQG